MGWVGKGLEACWVEKEINHAVMTVGGWFDAEDLYGPLNIYKNIDIQLLFFLDL
mgnify:CR=1 FL=1